MMSVIVPIIVIALTRYFSSSERLNKTSAQATFSINDLQKDLSTIQEHTDTTLKEIRTDIRDIWKRLEATDRAVFNLCWRLDNLEKQVNHSK